MSRKPNQAAVLIDPTTDAHDAQISKSATELALWQEQATENTRALAQQLGYDGLLTLEFLEQGIIESAERIGVELHIIGTRLLLIREQCSHGEFLISLEKVGLTPRGAQKIMQVALKFPNTPTLAHLHKLNKSKLFELALQDDDVLEVLESDGTVLGYKLDELDQMSVREMRIALREAKATNVANDKLLAAKDQKLNQLSRAVTKYTPDQKEQALRKALSDHELEVTATLDGHLRKSIQDLITHGEEHDKRYTELLAGHLLHIEASCQALREQFGINRALDDMPAWMANAPVAA